MKVKSRKSKVESHGPGPEERPAEPVLIGLDDMVRECQTEICVPVLVGGKVRRFAVRLLSPAQHEQLERMLAEVHPPAKPDPADPQKTVLDLSDTSYLKRIAERKRQVRAIGVYWSSREIQARKPGLVSDQEIYQFIQSAPEQGGLGLSETILQTLWEAIATDGASLTERINFT